MSVAAIPLPLADAPLSQPRLRVHPSGERLPGVQWIERHGAVLHPSPMGEEGEVLGLNLSRGCVHRCAFCSVRAYPSYPGDDVLLVYRDTAERLAEELATRRRRPRAVFVSPSTDPFPPIAEVQAETARVVEVLANHGVEAWLMTRGAIRPAALATLAAHRDHVKVTIGLTTLDESLQRLLEPLAAPPRLRLREIATLREFGIPTHVALDPLLPGLTDTRENLTELLQALSRIGVHHVSASYLFLRPGIEENLASALKRHGWDEKVLSAFQGGPMLATPGMAAARYLPKVRRQRGYATLMALGAGLDLRVTVSATTNPDFAAPRPSAAVHQPRLAGG